MDRIERLRALARDAKAMLDMAVESISNGRRDEALLHAEKAQNTLGKLLIAELGQEVGAVAWVPPMLLKAIANFHWITVATKQVNGHTVPLYTSPAHTSEARELTDAMVEAALDAQPFTADNVSHRVWQLVSQALTDEERRTMMRAALDAAIRREGGNG